MSFGVTPSDVAQYANGLTFADSAVGPPVIAATTPSLAAITAYIAQATQILRGKLLGWGVPPDSVTQAGTPDTYALCARIVARDAAMWALASRGRMVDSLAEYLTDRQREDLQLLHDSRQYIGSARSTGDNAPRLARGPQAPSDIAVNGVRSTSGAAFFRDSDGQL